MSKNSKKSAPKNVETKPQSSKPQSVPAKPAGSGVDVGRAALELGRVAAKTGGEFTTDGLYVDGRMAAATNGGVLVMMEHETPGALPPTMIPADVASIVARRLPRRPKNGQLGTTHVENDGETIRFGEMTLPAFPVSFPKVTEIVPSGKPVAEVILSTNDLARVMKFALEASKTKAKTVRIAMYGDQQSVVVMPTFGNGFKGVVQPFVPGVTPEKSGKSKEQKMAEREERNASKEAERAAKRDERQKEKIAKKAQRLRDQAAKLEAEAAASRAKTDDDEDAVPVDGSEEE